MNQITIFSCFLSLALLLIRFTESTICFDLLCNQYTGFYNPSSGITDVILPAHTDGESCILFASNPKFYCEVSPSHFQIPFNLTGVHSISRVFNFQTITYTIFVKELSIPSNTFRKIHIGDPTRISGGYGEVDELSFELNFFRSDLSSNQHSELKYSGMTLDVIGILNQKLGPNHFQLKSSFDSPIEPGSWFYSVHPEYLISEGLSPDPSLTSSLQTIHIPSYRKSSSSSSISSPQVLSGLPTEGYIEFVLPPSLIRAYRKHWEEYDREKSPSTTSRSKEGIRISLPPRAPNPNPSQPLTIRVSSQPSLPSQPSLSLPSQPSLSLPSQPSLTLDPPPSIPTLFVPPISPPPSSPLRVCVWGSDVMDGQKSIWLSQAQHMDPERFSFTWVLVTSPEHNSNQQQSQDERGRGEDGDYFSSLERDVIADLETEGQWTLSQHLSSPPSIPLPGLAPLSPVLSRLSSLPRVRVRWGPLNQLSLPIHILRERPTDGRASFFEDWEGEIQQIQTTIRTAHNKSFPSSTASPSHSGPADPFYQPRAHASRAKEREEGSVEEEDVYLYMHHRFLLARGHLPSLSPRWVQRIYLKLSLFLSREGCDLSVFGNLRNSANDVLITDVSSPLLLNKPTVSELLNLFLHPVIRPSAIVGPSHYSVHHPSIFNYLSRWVTDEGESEAEREREVYYYQRLPSPSLSPRPTGGTWPLIEVIAPSVDTQLFFPPALLPPHIPRPSLPSKYLPFTDLCQEEQLGQGQGQGPKRCVVVAFLARLSPEKNPGLLLLAASLLLSSSSPSLGTPAPYLRFLVIGDGAILQPLKELARRLRIDWAVSFPGWVDTQDLSAFLSAAGVDLVVNPSLRAWSETFCISNTEAMALGIPVITFAVGGIGEYVSEESLMQVQFPSPSEQPSVSFSLNNQTFTSRPSLIASTLASSLSLTTPSPSSTPPPPSPLIDFSLHRNALVLHSASPQNMAAALLLLSSQPSLRSALGWEGRRSILDRFSLRRQMDQYASLYERLVREGIV